MNFRTDPRRQVSRWMLWPFLALVAFSTLTFCAQDPVPAAVEARP